MVKAKISSSDLNWMHGIFSFACLVTAARSDMQLLGRSTSPLPTPRLIGGTCLGVSPFISDARPSKPLLKIQKLTQTTQAADDF